MIKNRLRDARQYIPLICLLLSFSCQKSREAKDSVDILENFAVLSTCIETSNIDFDKDAAASFLICGWAKPQDDFVMGVFPSSSLFFYSFDSSQDKECRIVCSPAPNLVKGQMSPFLNEEPLENINLRAGMHFYKLTLPAALLRVGKNRLRFEYSSTELGSENQIQPAIMVRALSIYSRFKGRESFFDLQKKGSLIQYSGSAFTSAHAFNRPVQLQLKYSYQGDVQASIIYESENGTKENHPLPKDQSEIELAIPVINHVPFKLDFIASGTDPRGAVVWKQIILQPVQKDTAEPAADATSPSLLATSAYDKTARPDIIVYIIDALRSDHLGCYGYSLPTSPYIDAFAEENTLFTHAYANSSWTRPSGATILTGLLPKHHKTMLVEHKLPPDVITLPEILKNHGYYTVAFNTNGNVGKGFGFDQGFDEFHIYADDIKTETVHVRSDVVNRDIFTFLQEYRKRSDRKPLFLWIWSTDPHDPYTPHESVSQTLGIEQFETLDKSYWRLAPFCEKREESDFTWPSLSAMEYLRTLYDQEILFNDLTFGQLLDQLKQNGIYDNSLILFTADHGEEFLDHNWFGHGKTLYNEQLRIPLIIKSDAINKGRFNDNVQLADIVPTMLDILGIDTPYALDGASLIGKTALKGRPIFAEEAHSGNYLRSLIIGKDKFIFNLASTKYLHIPWRVVYPQELYELEQDPGERKNLFDKMEILSAFMKHELADAYSRQPSGLDVEAETTELTEKQKEHLRGLGYIK